MELKGLWAILKKIYPGEIDTYKMSQKYRNVQRKASAPLAPPAPHAPPAPPVCDSSIVHRVE